MLEKEFELLKKGNSTALERIYIRYNKRIFWFGKQIIKDEFVVECLLQDVFLKLWEYREKIESPDHIFFFLRFVMKYSCYSHYAKPKNKFFRTVNSLENYENYQSYLAGYDPADVIENLNKLATLKAYLTIYKHNSIVLYFFYTIYSDFLTDLQSSFLNGSIWNLVT